MSYFFLKWPLLLLIPEVLNIFLNVFIRTCAYFYYKIQQLLILPPYIIYPNSLYYYWMDLDHLERQLLNINLHDESIQSIAQYCIVNSRNCESEIGKVIDKHFPSYYDPKMLALLKLVSEIFVKTGEKKQDRFFKPLAPKAKVYIQQISKRYKQIKPEHIKVVPEVLSNWSRPGKELFAHSFMDKLKKIAEPIYATANRLDEERRNNLFEHYSKTFLMQYEDIKSYEPTSRIYDGYVSFEKIASEIGQINNEMKKLGLEIMTPEIRGRATQLRRTLEKFTQKLQDIICKYHVDFKILREACKQQYQKLPLDAKQIIDKETTEG